MDRDALIKACLRRSVEMLARREHARKELRLKLERLDLASEGGGEERAAAIEACLDELAARGYQSDARYAEAYAASKAARYGNRRLAADLRAQDVAWDAIEPARQALPGDLERARRVWAKRFGEPPRDARDKARQMRFMDARGFGYDVFASVLAEQG